jgi:glutathionylspermidine synthase
MRRVTSLPRPFWQRRVEEAGLVWHSGPEFAHSECVVRVKEFAHSECVVRVNESQAPYWNECAFYEFSAREVDLLEAATNELAQMALEAAQHILDERLYKRLAIPDLAIPLIEQSWQAEPPSLYGRFDLAYDGTGPPKLLEYNADTPTSLLEAAVVQWYWLEDVFPQRDQFNSLHPRLVERWRELAGRLPRQRLHFCSTDDAEDGMTVTYLLETAQQAGLTASISPIDEIGWNGAAFVDPQEEPLTAIFKLYPWEWMVREEFGKFIETASAIWIEPPWKMLLSNKGILPILWQLYPGHPNLLEAYFDVPGQLQYWAGKPMLGREGANVAVHSPDGNWSSNGSYGAEGFVFQDLARIKSFDGKFPVIGSWMVGDAASGMGIRESSTPITSNTSQFVPHLFD